MRTPSRFYGASALFAMDVNKARAQFEALQGDVSMATEAMMYLGHCEAVQNHVDAALDWYKRIEQRYPASYAIPAALWHGSQLLKRAGRTQEADAMLADVRQRFPLSIYASKRARSQVSRRGPPHDRPGWLGF